MNNQTRRELLNRHRQSGFPGSIMDVFSAYDAGRDIISEFVQEQQGQQQLQQMQQMQQQQQQPQPIVANTPEQQEQGLRPFHERGQVDQSMVFPNIPANAPFNTVGMKAPINIDKYDNNGHLIESFKSVPPGIQNLPTGPQEGTVVETPANMQTGGVRRYQTAGPRRNTNAEITTLQPMDVRPDPLVRDRPAQRVIDPRAQRQAEEQAFQTLMFNKTNEWRDPNNRAAMTSGRAESVSPATYVTPAGDLQAIIESGAQIAKGDYVGGGLGAGLAAASVLLPGTIRVPNSAQDLFEAANTFKRHDITSAEEAANLVERVRYDRADNISEELRNASGMINTATDNARQLYRDVFPYSSTRGGNQDNTSRLINSVLADNPQLAATYHTGMMNSPEVGEAVRDFGKQYLTSFRGVTAPDAQHAAKYLTSPFGGSDRIHGPGVYTGGNPDMARTYGNYIGELMPIDITPNMSGKQVMGAIQGLIQEGSVPFNTGVHSLYDQKQFEGIVNSLIGNPQFGDSYEEVYQNLLRTFGQPTDFRRGILDTDGVRVITGTAKDRIVPKIVQMSESQNFTPIVTPIWQQRWIGGNRDSQYFFQKQGFKKYGGLLRSGSVSKYQEGGSKNVDPFSAFEVAKHMARIHGGTPQQYLALSDTSGYHESGHTMDPKMVQRGSGIAKGAFQIEASTVPRLQQRVRQYAEQTGNKVPSWINIPNNDARNLSLDRQRALFLLDMNYSEGTNMRAYAQGKTTSAEQWLRGWKRKEAVDGKDIERFETSANKARQMGIPNSALTEFNRMVQGKKPTPPSGSYYDLIRQLNPLNQYK